MRTVTRTRKLVECALMLAVSAVLSLPFLSFQFWPNGGSITICSMLPIILISYRHGIKWGLATGFANALLQLILGINGLRGIDMGTLIAAIFLDYILAYTILGLGGMFKGKLKKQSLELICGSAVVVFGRFICHFVSGVLLWGAWAPEGMGAVVYSLGYNGSYMGPELIITCIGAGVIGSLLTNIGNPEATHLV